MLEQRASDRIYVEFIILTFIEGSYHEKSFKKNVRIYIILLLNRTQL